MELFGTLFFLFCAGTHSPVIALNVTCPHAWMATIDHAAWLKGEANLSVPFILEHISPADAAPGAVIAAKTRVAPNYYYHWVRDAGLVLDSLVPAYESASGARRATLQQKFKEYVGFSARLQASPALSGLGEPKFNVDASTFNGEWGRPQNDSPALRVISLIDWAKTLALEDDAFVNEHVLPVVKADLAYIAQNWTKPSYDLWEEIEGDHFYTRMVQRRALLEGARFLAAHHADDLAHAYAAEGAKIGANLIPTFWNEQKDYFEATKNAQKGLANKASELDTAVVLGLLHGGMTDDFLPANDARVQKTVAKLIAVFKGAYVINRRHDLPGVAIGRYPEDEYGGADRKGGNPWPLCTLAIAELQYRAAALEAKADRRDHARELIAQADQLVARVQTHANPDGSLSEQIDRHTGFMTSVSELTWNYAAILTTNAARERALRP